MARFRDSYRARENEEKNEILISIEMQKYSCSTQYALFKDHFGFVFKVFSHFEQVIVVNRSIASYWCRLTSKWRCTTGGSGRSVHIYKKIFLLLNVQIHSVYSFVSDLLATFSASGVEVARDRSVDFRVS